MKSITTTLGLLLFLRLTVEYPVVLSVEILDTTLSSWHQLVVQPYRDRP